MFLEQQWSPEEIAGRLSYECSNLKISYNTIYRAIYLQVCLIRHMNVAVMVTVVAIRKLRHKGKTRHKKGDVERRGKIKISNSIEERTKKQTTGVELVIGKLILLWGKPVVHVCLH